MSTDLWTDFDSRLGEIFLMIPEKTFAGLSLTTEADLLQLPPVIGKLIYIYIYFFFFGEDSMKHLLGLQLWHLFRYTELTEFVRQKTINCLSTCFIKFELVTLMMMQKNS